MKNPVRYFNHSNTPLRSSYTPIRRHSNVAVSHHGNHLALTNVARLLLITGLLAQPRYSVLTPGTPFSSQVLRAHPKYLAHPGTNSLS